MSKTILNLEGIGLVEICTRISSTRRVLQVKADGSVRYSGHPRERQKDIVDFIFARKEWIEQTRERMRSCAPQKLVFVSGQTYDFGCFDLIIQPSCTSREIYSRFTDEKDGNRRTLTIVTRPDFDCASNPDFQDFVRSRINNVLNFVARKTFPERLRILSEANGFEPRKLDFRNMRSQWGSCSTSGRICLNIQLARLGGELIDFVILHELCHLQHPNHGRDFHALLNKVSGGKSTLYEEKIKKCRVGY